MVYIFICTFYVYLDCLNYYIPGNSNYIIFYKKVNKGIHLCIINIFTLLKI